MNVFDIVGPVMIGPSSSHTAGAARAGAIASKLLGDVPKRALITLHGSFAHTYYGHGTDRALIGGILGFAPSDPRLKDSFKYAEKAGLDFEITCGDLGDVHPNTVRINLTGMKNMSVSVVISSVGGGVINIIKIDDADVLFSAEYNTTVVFNEDKAGVVAYVSGVFAEYNVNIAFMRLFRKEEGENAIMVIESDQGVSDEALGRLRRIDGISKVIYIEPFLR